MKFTKPTIAKNGTISVNFRAKDSQYWIDVDNGATHPGDSAIRSCLRQTGFNVSAHRGYSYKITGGTGEDLHKLIHELEVEYGLVEPIEDVALLSKVAIEVAVAASKTNGSRLDHDDFHAGFNAIDAAKNDEFMNVCLETARAIVGLIK